MTLLYRLSIKLKRLQALLPIQCWLVLFSLVLLSPCAFGLRVIVDPGHGGDDHGAVRAGVKESDIVLRVSQFLEAFLKKDTRFKVQLTRRDDRFLSLQERVHIADNFNAEVFVSIHANSSPNPRARGAEFFFQNQLPPEEEALFLANRENQHAEASEPETGPLSRYPADVRAILEDLHREHRILKSYQLSQIMLSRWQGPVEPTSAIRQAPFFVVSRTQMPSVLVELGFVSHDHEREQLTETAYQMQMAHSIYQALQKYKEKLDNSVL